MVKINQVLGKTTTLLQPGTLPPVDIFPFLKLVPEVLLGNWVSKVMEVRNEMNELYASYLDMVARRRKEEGPRESFADRLIEQQDELGWSWHQLCFMAGLMMEAGSDTTSNTINTFTHLMTKFPEIAKRAQKQIDAVIGEERTPVWADFDTLPIVNAIIKETIRLRPIAPIGFPHALSEGVEVASM
jgi:cytochrome P450